MIFDLKKSRLNIFTNRFRVFSVSHDIVITVIVKYVFLTYPKSTHHKNVIEQFLGDIDKVFLIACFFTFFCSLETRSYVIIRLVQSTQLFANTDHNMLIFFNNCNIFTKSTQKLICGFIFLHRFSNFFTKLKVILKQFR